MAYSNERKKIDGEVSAEGTGIGESETKATWAEERLYTDGGQRTTWSQILSGIILPVAFGDEAGLVGWRVGGIAVDTPGRNEQERIFGRRRAQKRM